MAKIRPILVLFIFCFLQKQQGYAQLGISNEIGVLVGPSSFYTDYGERYNIHNNVNNSGIGIGLVHYINFAYKAECSCYTTGKYFNDHFRIRTEIDYFRANLEQIGPVAMKKTIGGKLLRAMHGRARTFEAGSALEYYPLSIRDFRAHAYLFSPFISAGVHYVYYHPEAYSDFGPLSDPTNVFPTFVGGIDLSSGSAWDIAVSMGARYKLGPSSDLAFEMRWHYYSTDWIDGLNIDAPQNKANDWVVWLNVGYIYYLDF